MSLRHSENRLFKEWQSKRKRFVSDGVVRESVYLASLPRLLFVLKEVNDPHDGGWDLRSFLRAGGRPQTWDNIARWVEGIKRLPKDIPWCDLSEMDENKRRDLLQTIVAINLKKSPGGHTTNSLTLSRTATEDRIFLNRQFSLYQPDLVICCGAETSNVFHSLIDFERPPTWQRTRRGVCFHEFGKEKFVVQFAHPEARVSDSLLYYGLVDAVREIIRS